MKKSITFLLAFILFFAFTNIFSGCEKNIKEVDNDGDKLYVIPNVSSEVLDITETTTLYEYMVKLRENGELLFETKSDNDLMITSINGKKGGENSYWMLYTNDKDNANDAWGRIEFEGELYGSAMFGVGDLIIKEGCSYIWRLEKL